MNVETLTLITASLTSLLFSYVPGLKNKFEQLDGTQKRLVMVCALGIVAITCYGISCSELRGWLENPLRCDQSGMLALIKLWFDALVANQATYALSPRITREV